MLIVDCHLDDVVDIERRTSIGTVVLVFDLFRIIFFRVDLPPRRLIRHRCTCTRNAIDDENGVGHGIGGYKFDIGLFGGSGHI